jgi:hypothetical protein
MMPEPVARQPQPAFENDLTKADIHQRFAQRVDVQVDEMADVRKVVIQAGWVQQCLDFDRIVSSDVWEIR